jgi:type VI protein secretion system component Hcp
MAEGEGTDLIMKFVLNGAAIQGESTTNLISVEGRSNPLLTGFKQKSMFEIDSFTFKSGVIDDSTPKQAKTPAAAPAHHGKPPAVAPAQSTPGEFQMWRAGKSHKYPVDLQPVSFTRSIDMSSTQLIQSCIDRVVFDSATLIKRKAAGGQAAGEVFLRLDFHGVLVVGVEWSNDIEVKETCQFICRSTTISYRPQLPDGTLGGTIARFWSMVPNATQLPYA